MAEQVTRDYERARAEGRARGLEFVAGTAVDLVVSGMAERWNPAWAVAEPPRRKGEAMREGLSEWLRDLRLAFRSLRRSPGFAIVSIGTLGLAIGANAGIFSVVDTVLLKPMPYPEPDRLVYIGASAPGSDLPEEFQAPLEFYVQYREESALLEDAGLVTEFTATLRTKDRAERVPFSMVTPTLFSTLRVSPILGRLPTAEDEDRVAVISHGLWMTWFGGDESVLGQSYEMVGSQRTVIGVMGPEFQFPSDDVAAWIPFVVRPEQIVPGRGGIPIVARTKPNVTLDALHRELMMLARRLPERFGGTAHYEQLIEQHRPVIRSLEEELLGDVKRPLWILLASVTIVLLIACANVTNLLIVRSERRQRDLAVRQAIGAARHQLIRSQLSESILIAIAAAVVALLLTWVTVPLILRAAPTGIPRLGEVSVTAATIGFAVIAAVVSALLCGMVPALRAAAPDLSRLREAGRGATRRRSWVRDALVIGQTSLALVLLIGSGLLIRSFQALRNVDPGYDTRDILTFQIAPEGEYLPDAHAYARFHTEFMERVRALPGVQSVGIVENVPLNEGLASGRFRKPESGTAEDAGTLLNFTWAAGDYFETMGISVLRGRVFTEEDHFSHPGNVIMSQAAANLLWPGEDPIGRRLQRGGLESWETVVGVVEDVMQYGFRDTSQPLVYFPLIGQNPSSWVISSPAYVVKSPREENLVPEIRALARQVAPEAPMYRIYTMAGLAADSMVQLSFTMLTLGIAAALALLLGAVGLYGVLSYVVAERTQEIGVRMALGAEAKRVRRMVVVQGVRVVVIGVLVGAAAAIGVTRSLGGLLYGVAAIDGTTFVAMAALMMLVGILASYLPARRASSVDPIQSLRMT
jgi:predicted permease